MREPHFLCPPVSYMILYLPSRNHSSFSHLSISQRKNHCFGGPAIPIYRVGRVPSRIMSIIVVDFFWLITGWFPYGLWIFLVDITDITIEPMGFKNTNVDIMFRKPTLQIAMDHIWYFPQFWNTPAQKMDNFWTPAEESCSSWRAVARCQCGKAWGWCLRARDDPTRDMLFNTCLATNRGY
jgi:hypothetical protein